MIRCLFIGGGTSQNDFGHPTAFLDASGLEAEKKSEGTTRIALTILNSHFNAFQLGIVICGLGHGECSASDKIGERVQKCSWKRVTMNERACIDGVVRYLESDQSDKDLWSSQSISIFPFRPHLLQTHTLSGCHDSSSNHTPSHSFLSNDGPVPRRVILLYG